MSKLTESVREGAQALFERAGDLQERIRERAHAIWEREGRPQDRDQDHWNEAEKEVATEEAAAAETKSAVKQAKAGQARDAGRLHAGKAQPRQEDDDQAHRLD